MSVRESVVLVTGLARCGSSLTMQMLEAGGFPVCGSFPAYEDVPTAFGDGFDQAWLAQQRGRAVKVLDPQRPDAVLPVPSMSIFLSRLPREQARSQLKFLRLVSGLHVRDSDAARVAGSLRRDAPRALRKLRACGPVLVIRFEDILSAPRAAAERMADFLQQPLAIAAMAEAVVPRSPWCAPGLLIEAAQVERSEQPDG